MKTRSHNHNTKEVEEEKKEPELECVTPSSIVSDNSASENDNDSPQKLPPSSSSSSASSFTCIGISIGRIATFSLSLLRLLTTLALLVVFALYVSTLVAQHVVETYIQPLILSQVMTPERRSRELTYYHRYCTKDDITTRNVRDLVIDYGTMTTDDALRKHQKHGAAVFPNLMKASTAQSVRDFILRQNAKNEDMIYVIENEHRWSFGMRVDQDPSIGIALKEVLSHEFLVEALEKIVGPDPAVIEFTGITSAYGAKVQRYHADVVPEGNGAKWGLTFAPSFSLFIPLQNISAAMGATEICPGSHMCADGCFEYCPDEGIQVSGEDDNWPQGYGALVNQQLMHRGAAHVDPNGPERVLFILTFAPRPRFHHAAVETRMIGQGGSYSLHWSQWGHTLRDFRDSSSAMAQPYRILRSFGLYNNKKSKHWGYDFITQASARIANNELGFYHADLVSYAEKGGFELIPDFLQAKDSISDEPEEESATGSYDAWMPYYLNTLQKCQDFFQKAHLGLLVLSLLLLVLTAVLKARGSSNRHHSNSNNATATSRSTTAFLLAVHAVIICLGYKYRDAVAASPWGRNIRAGRSYRWPQLPHSSFLAPPSSLFPGTLPTRNDIMVFDDLQSEYLALFTDIMDVLHPGNAAWLQEMAIPHSVGYRNLTPSLQIHLCTSLLQWNRQLGRRVLIKNDQNQWADLMLRNHHDGALRWCHKELVQLSSETPTKQAIRQLDFLLTEAKFGYWRETALVRGGWIPGLLIKLQHEILGFGPLVATQKSIRKSKSLLVTRNNLNNNSPPHPSLLQDVTKKVTTTQIQPPWPFLKRLPLPLLSKVVSPKDLGSARATRVLSQETVSAAVSAISNNNDNSSAPPSLLWFQEGDVVEAAYASLRTEWYRATVIGVNADTMTWNVVYQDGEEEVGLCYQCVRTWTPYQLDEEVGWRAPGGTVYEEGRIVGIVRHGNNRDSSNNNKKEQEPFYSVRVGGKVHKNVRTNDLRRNVRHTAADFVAGTRVQVYYSEEDEWYDGVITNANRDGTFAVHFDDGDFLPKVALRDLAIAPTSPYY